MERIYGIDPGYLAKQGLLEKVNNYPEYRLFLLLRGLHSVSFYMAHEGEHISEDTELGIAYLEQLTTKFGVQMEEPGLGKECLRTESFYKWYDFWDNHFESLSSEEWNSFEKDINLGKDVTRYLPENKWNDQEVELIGGRHK